MGAFVTSVDSNAASEITGSGTANTITMFTAPQVIGDSIITQNSGATFATVGGGLVLGASTTSIPSLHFNAGVAPSALVSGDVYYTTAATTGFNYYSNDGTSTGFHTVFSNAVNQIGFYLNNATSVQMGSVTAADLSFFVNNGAAALVIQQPSGKLIFQPYATSSGSVGSFVFTNPARTGNTVGTENTQFNVSAGSIQWATGAITTQRHARFIGGTYSAVGASTITDAYGLYVDAPTASTNITITNNWAAGFSGRVAVGSVAPPTGQRAFVVTEDTAYTTIGSLTTDTSRTAIYFNQATPGGTNYALSGTSTNTYLNGLSSITFNVGGTQYGRIRNSDWNFNNGVAGAGSAIQFLFTNAANTNQTLSTNIPSFKVAGSSIQWATGTLATQYFTYLSANTVAFVGASTATNVYGLYVEAATAGTNATITNNYGLGVSGNTIVGSLTAHNTSGLGTFRASQANSHIDIGELSTNVPAMWMNSGANIPTSSNYAISSGAGNNALLLNAPATNAYIRLQTATTNRLIITGITTSGVSSQVEFITASVTGQGASTEIPGFLVNSYSRQWATGAITTQREAYWKTVTYTAVAASVITNAYGAYFEKPTASTNITITNNFGLGTDGDIFLGGSNLYVGIAIGSTSSTNYAITSSGSTNRFNASGTSVLSVANVAKVSATSENITFTTSSPSSGAYTGFTFTQSAPTNQTLSTEITGFKFTGQSRQWATGAITTQRETYFSSTVYTAVGASVITNAYGAYFEAPTASTNITITNKFAIGLSGGGLGLAAATTAYASIIMPIGSAPLSLLDGALWYDSTQNSRISYIGGINQYETNSLFIQTQSVTVANTVTETAITGTGIGTLTLPANFLVAGKTIRLRGQGFNSSTGTPNITIKIKFGSTVILTTGVIATGNGTNDGFDFEGVITCRTTGGSGTVFSQGYYFELHTLGVKSDMTNTATTTIDTTTTQALTATVEWGTAAAGNTITMTNFTMEVMS